MEVSSAHGRPAGGLKAAPQPSPATTLAQAARAENSNNNNTMEAIDESNADRHVISDQELNECDREKLHLIGSIQGGAGHAFIISFPDITIRGCDCRVCAVPWVRKRDVAHAAANKKRRNVTSEEIIQNSSPHNSNEGDLEKLQAVGKEGITSADELIGSPLQAWLPYDLFQKISDAIESMKKSRSKRTFLFYQYKEDSYAVSLSTSDRQFTSICIEIEEVESSDASGEFYSTLGHLGRVMEFYADEKVLTHACDTVFKLLGHYDRGMVYKFNDDNSGEVVHEIKSKNVTTSYLGMRFPAGDIPLPARQLYIQNGLRYIQNVDAEDVPLISEAPIDLANCRMRAVSKPHIIYLRNMGVVCSLSVAIVVDNELWGLLAFHGYTDPFKPSLHQRIACETINSMVSVKVESIVKKSQSARVMDLSEALIKWDSNQDAPANLKNLGDTLLKTLDAEVLVAKILDAPKNEPVIVVLGDESLVPGEAVWDYFAAQLPREVYAADTRQAITNMGLTENDCPASGIAYYRDGLVQIILGRGLRSKDVMWGGNPDEPKLRIGGILCPRNSFDIFMEKARKESRSWSLSDVSVFQAFMVRVCEFSHMRMVSSLKDGIEQANVKYYEAIGRAQENREFFEIMSKEIRTPFHGVMGCLNILHDTMEEMTESDIQDIIDTALSSGNHMINLLNDVLCLEKHRQCIVMAEDRLAYTSLKDEAIKALRSLAASKKIKFSCEVTPSDDKIAVITDRSKLVQVVSNIVNNAIKFSPGGSVKVQYRLFDSLKESVDVWSTESAQYECMVFTMEENQLFDSIDSVHQHILRFDGEKSDKRWMLVSVVDSGCGIRPKGLAEIFQPYTQSSRGSNRVFQGTSLGIFICQSLTLQMQGFLACSSTSNRGTVFHVGIPVKVEVSADGEVAKSSDKAQKPATGQKRPIPLRGPIAVCDDNVVNVKILKRGLQLDLHKHDMEVEILTADGGITLLDLYKEKRPSLLFVDYHMPDLDGSEATKQIRQYEAEKGLKPAYIIIYTADLTDEAQKVLLSCGLDEIMAKPPPKGALATIVTRLVQETP